MSDPQDEDRDFPFVDFIDDPISAHADAPQPRKIAFEKFADVGVFGKQVDGFHDPQAFGLR